MALDAGAGRFGSGSGSESGGPWGSWADRHPQAALLDGALPGPELVEHLAHLEVADLDDPALVEVMAGWDRVASWAIARQAIVVAEMTRRAGGSRVEFVADEVAARLGVSRRAGQNTVDLAVGLAAFPAVHDALGRGDVDVRKATALLVQTEHLPDDVARAVHEAVLPGAPGWTTPQLVAQIRRVETAMDPVAAARRHERARAQRCVRLVPAPDAMAWIHALLPAPDAMIVHTTLDALAACAPPDDPRGVDARRADALSDLCRHHLDTGLDLAGTPLPPRHRRRPHLHLTVPATALAPSAAGAPGTALASGSDVADPSGRPRDGVAVLAGYGPVPLAAVRDLLGQATWRPVATDPRTGELAARGAHTYRPGAAVGDLVLDRDVTCTFPGCRTPATRCDLDHIDPFDHRVPASGGPTTPDNLHTLCRHHHRLKTSGTWTPVRDPATGVTTWTSPTGHTYTRDPHPTDPDVYTPPRPIPRPTTAANPVDNPTDRPGRPPGRTTEPGGPPGGSTAPGGPPRRSTDPGGPPRPQKLTGTPPTTADGPPPF